MFVNNVIILFIKFYTVSFILFNCLNVQRKPDIDGSGGIEFEEYVRVMATYCMFTKDEILRFCFECFDVDGSGTIDEKEFIELCKLVLIYMYNVIHQSLHACESALCVYIYL